MIKLTLGRDPGLKIGIRYAQSRSWHLSKQSIEALEKVDEEW